MMNAVVAAMLSACLGLFRARAAPLSSVISDEEALVIMRLLLVAVAEPGSDLLLPQALSASTRVEDLSVTLHDVQEDVVFLAFLAEPCSLALASRGSGCAAPTAWGGDQRQPDWEVVERPYEEEGGRRG